MRCDGLESTAVVVVVGGWAVGCGGGGGVRVSVLRVACGTGDPSAHSRRVEREARECLSTCCEWAGVSLSLSGETDWLSVYLSD